MQGTGLRDNVDDREARAIKPVYVFRSDIVLVTIQFREDVAVSTKFFFDLVGCTTIALSFCLGPRELRGSQPDNPSAGQNEEPGKAGRSATSLQGELRRELDAVFKVQIDALELQKRQLAEDEADQARQIKEQEAEAIAQLKAEFERQLKQINRQAAAQIDQLNKTAKRQAAQLDLQAAMLKAQLGLQSTVMAIQASREESRIDAARRRSSSRQN
jgi:hypothetical protein